MVVALKDRPREDAKDLGWFEERCLELWREEERNLIDLERGSGRVRGGDIRGWR